MSGAGNGHNYVSTWGRTRTGMQVWRYTHRDDRPRHFVIPRADWLRGITGRMAPVDALWIIAVHLGHLPSSGTELVVIEVADPAVIR